MTSERAIVTAGLGKSYGELRALDDVSLEIQAGEVFGLLGPNGAGKSTLLRILMGLLIAGSGSARILGQDCFSERTALKRQVGYLPDTPFFYDYLSGWEMLRFMAEMHGLEAAEGARRAQRLLDELQLTSAAHDYVTAYSLGMKKKMALALVLLHQPKVLILDEPTTGLDPAASRNMRQMLRQYADAGRTVLLSTHWLDMADSLCDRVGVIHRGRLVACDAPAALRARAGGESSLEEVFLQLTAEQESEQQGAIAVA